LLDRSTMGNLHETPEMVLHFSRSVTIMLHAEHIEYWNTTNPA
jgi:hypothetical protein